MDEPCSLVEFRSQIRRLNDNSDDVNAGDDEDSSINTYAREVIALNNHSVNNILFHMTGFIIKTIFK